MTVLKVHLRKEIGHSISNINLIFLIEKAKLAKHLNNSKDFNLKISKILNKIGVKKVLLLLNAKYCPHS